MTCWLNWHGASNARILCAQACPRAPIPQGLPPLLTPLLAPLLAPLLTPLLTPLLAQGHIRTTLLAPTTRVAEPEGKHFTQSHGSTRMDPWHFSAQGATVSALVTVLVASVFVYFAGRIVVDRSSILAAILTAVLGTLLGTFVWGLLPGVLGMVLGVLAWGLVAAFFYRTKWTKGALIGVVAWLLWFLVTAAITALL